LEFRGVFDHGVVRPSEPVAIPDGTEVQCRSVSGLADATDSSAFWREPTLESLALAQQVKPIRSLGDLKGDWPDDESIDDFLDALKKWRQ